ncbi:hypothetical protein Q1695_010684 [Nippostrongylus brasiliensis]|nr:hypothetical protein Q1695_010684 [Nippostrongylus brasiliensis]
MKVNSIVFLFACLQSYTFIAIVQRDDQSDEYNRFTAPKGADADKAGSNSNSDKSRKTRDNIYVHLDLEKLAEGAAAAMRRISTNATTTTSREGKNEEFQLLYRDSLGKPCSLEHMGFAEMMSKSGCFRAKEYVDQVCDPFFRCMAGKGNNFFSCEPRICSEYRRAKYRPACKLFVCE